MVTEGAKEVLRKREAVRLSKTLVDFKEGRINESEVQDILILHDFYPGDIEFEELLRKNSPENSLMRDSRFVYVPSIKCYVAKERSLFGKNWTEANEELHKQGFQMPTAYEFRAFLRFARDSQDYKYKKLFGKLTRSQDLTRQEWLNARFERKSDGLYSITFEGQEQKLDDCLMEDRKPGTSLDGWVDSYTKHGLPSAKNPGGSLYYTYPREKSSVMFSAYSRIRTGLEVGLICDGFAPMSLDSLGVRAIKDVRKEILI